MSCPYAFHPTITTNSNSANSTKSDDEETATSTTTTSTHHPSPIASLPHSIITTTETATATTETKMTAMEALQLAKASCPAFKQSCPFRDVQDAYSMKKALENLPLSHYQNTHTSIRNENNGNSTDTQKNQIGTISNKTDEEVKRRDSNPEIISQSLRVALEHVHTISQSLKGTNNNHSNSNDTNDQANNTKNAAPTATASNLCPYKTLFPKQYQQKHNGNPLKFVTVMEEFSLNAILAKLIEKEQDDNINDNSTIDTRNNNNETKSTTSTITSSKQQEVQSTQLSSSSSSTSTSSSIRKSYSNSNLLLRQSLSTALKIGTTQSHSSAESVHFIKNFIKGIIQPNLYIILLQNLYWVYKTLEYELDIYAPIEFPTLYKRELYRVKSLEDDLEFFIVGLDFDQIRRNSSSSSCGGGGRSSHDGKTDVEEVLKRKIPPSPATIDYMNRIEYIAKTEPLLLLSHAYTRYLGDLSGGKVLARVAKRALNLSSSSFKSTTTNTSQEEEGLKEQQQQKQHVIDGLSFYHFPLIPSAKKFKDEFRFALDNLDFLTTDQIERLVAEANVAFVLNMRIFEELDVLDGVDGSFVRDYKEATCYYEDCIKEQSRRKERNVNDDIGDDNDEQEISHEPELESQCPFAKLGGPNPHKMFNNTSSGSISEQQHVEQNVKMMQNGNKDISSKGIDIDETKANKKHSSSARCPWPFIFFHDPIVGLQDWQTWVVIGLLLSWAWTKMLQTDR